MSAQFEAAWEMHCFLSNHKIPYVVIGGLAVQYWGEPRFTQDIDLTVAIPLEQTESFVKLVVKHFKVRVKEIIDFTRQTRVIPVLAQNGYKIDISLSIPGYEEKVMEHSVEYEIEKGKIIHLCSAEDLIIHKAVAGRPRDYEDIEGIVYRQGNSLDVEYIRLWLKEFAYLLENSELIARFEKPWQKLMAIKGGKNFEY
ncbi:MAG: nucleotidyltransferase [bacterium]|nr:nucleotidyltransferase [bacterium]